VLYSGGVATFTAAASGAPPLTYQWQLNGTNIIGATNSTLVVSNATVGGSYKFIVVNSSGNSVTSSVVTLTFIVPTYQYEKAVLADKPVAYWRLNETNNPATGTAPAYDYIAGLNGTYGTGSQNAFNGVAGPRSSGGFYGFETNNSALGTINGTANSYVTTAAGLKLNTNTVTITAWIKPTGTQNGAAGVVFCRDGVTTSGLNYNGTTMGFTWNNNEWWWGSGLTPPSGVWSFVVLVVSTTNGATLYVYNTNGLLSAIDTTTNTGVIQAFAGPTIIGSDPYDYTGRAFNGTIDEVAVFNYSLSQAQVNQLYIAGVSSPLFISRSGGNLLLNWTYGTLLQATNLTGPWTTNTATSPYTVTPTGPKEFYRLQLQ
jgi:hypothetical protein